VKIRALGAFKELFGCTSLTIKLKKNTTLKRAIQELDYSLTNKSKRLLVHYEISDVWLNALILVNGKEISVLNGLETIISNGDEIVLLPVSHGG